MIHALWYMKHDSWWVVNIFLDILDWLQFTLLKNLPLKFILTFNQFFYNMTAIKYFLLFSLVSKKLTNYERRHFKLFAFFEAIKCLMRGKQLSFT